jgi:16S rRNA (guanine527-N7)-methyltransferase
LDTARIAGLLAPYLDRSLSESQLKQISMYIDLLLRWNARINLTAIRNEAEIVTRHFGESFFMARHLFPEENCHPERSQAEGKAVGVENSKEPDDSSRQASHSPSQSPLALPGLPRVLDIGSGAGFPGIPLKLWAPHIDLTLVESNHKKATFLREVIRTLTLTNVNVSTDRAEALAGNPSFPRADVVTLRAVERLESVVPQARALLRNEGRLAFLVGRDQLSGLTGPSIRWQPPISIPQAERTVLVTGIAM